jgi:hypothetical protein
VRVWGRVTRVSSLAIKFRCIYQKVVKVESCQAHFDRANKVESSQVHFCWANKVESSQVHFCWANKPQSIDKNTQIRILLLHSLVNGVPMTCEGPASSPMIAAPFASTVTPDVLGFSDDPSTEDVIAYQAEMMRRNVTKIFMRTVLKPLVTALPFHQAKSLCKHPTISTRAHSCNSPIDCLICWY